MNQMKHSYTIITDSGSDLPKSLAKELGIHVISLSVLVDGEEPKDDLLVDPKDFYGKLRSGKMAKTAAINLDQFLAEFEPFLKDGQDILYLGFSSGLSSTYHAAVTAAEELRETYPDRKIITVDTLAASLGQGLIVYYAAKLREEGKTPEETAKWVEDHRLSLAHWFTVDDLHFLKRGGRVSAATAMVGSMLQIKPVMHVDDEGHLVKVTTARGRRASIKALFDKIRETGIEPEKQIFFISHGDCREDAEYLASLIREMYGDVEIVIDYIGAVIGAHSGPGTVALFFMGKNR
jgi:DegV family protein with EDD domain